MLLFFSLFQPKEDVSMPHFGSSLSLGLEGVKGELVWLGVPDKGYVGPGVVGPQIAEEGVGLGVGGPGIAVVEGGLGVDTEVLPLLLATE